MMVRVAAAAGGAGGRGERRLPQVVDKLRERRAQMMVELCVVFPVVIAIAVIAVNALHFFSYCGEFDRMVRNSTVRNTSVVDVRDSFNNGSWDSWGRVASVLASEFDYPETDWRMNVTRDFLGYDHYEMTMRYTPTLFGMRLREDIFGVRMPQLEHKISMVVYPYDPTGRYEARGW